MRCLITVFLVLGYVICCWGGDREKGTSRFKTLVQLENNVAGYRQEISIIEQHWKCYKDKTVIERWRVFKQAFSLLILTSIDSMIVNNCYNSLVKNETAYLNQESSGNLTAVVKVLGCNYISCKKKSEELRNNINEFLDAVYTFLLHMAVDIENLEKDKKIYFSGSNYYGKEKIGVSDEQLLKELGGGVTMFPVCAVVKTIINQIDPSESTVLFFPMAGMGFLSGLIKKIIEGYIVFENSGDCHVVRGIREQAMAKDTYRNVVVCAYDRSRHRSNSCFGVEQADLVDFHYVGKQERAVDSFKRVKDIVVTHQCRKVIMVLDAPAFGKADSRWRSPLDEALKRFMKEFSDLDKKIIYYGMDCFWIRKKALGIRTRRNYAFGEKVTRNRVCFRNPFRVAIKRQQELYIEKYEKVNGRFANECIMVAIPK